MSDPIPDVAEKLRTLRQQADPVSEARQEDLVPGGTVVGKMGGVLLWADTPEEADRAREMIDLLADAIKPSDEGEMDLSDNGAGVLTGTRQSWWQRIFR